MVPLTYWCLAVNTLAVEPVKRQLLKRFCMPILSFCLVLYGS